MAFNWQNGMEGTQMVSPFNEREYVTLTGYDSVKNQVNFRDPRGKEGRIGGGSIDVNGLPPKDMAPIPKKTVKVSKGRAPYNAESGVITPSAEQAQQSDSSRRNTDLAVTTGKTTAQVLQDQDASYRNAQKAIAAGDFLVDVLNANSAYQNTTAVAGMNIVMARNSAADSVYRGRQAALSRQSEGYQAGNDATLAMAAQGQDVRGHATQKLKGSYEAVGYMNAATEQINSIREAMGYQLEEVNYEYQQEMAGVTRDAAITGSALKAGLMLAVL